MPASEHLCISANRPAAAAAARPRPPAADSKSPRGRGPQFFVERNAHPLARSRKPDRTLMDPVAGLFEDQRLRADLHALRLVGPFGDMRTLALLGVDGRDGTVLA